ncbi:MAG: FtsQ-type POTRA domain-containing protein [Acidimicrobiia bacterium]|nr:FtsQ-type POTRA domain-containing protein [Acidimicrobiia bacterium]
MTAIDRRIAVRRQTVRETGARRSLRHLMVALLFILAVGLIAMLLQSPVMAVREIEIAGANRADVERVLDRYRVEVGVPTISIRPDDLVTGVELDPWVAKAQATVTWPGTVSLVVLEHEPVAWADIAGEWYRVSGTGAILEESQPLKRGARVELKGVSGQLGEVVKGKRALAALEFLSVLTPELRRRATVTSGGNGTLIARVQGHLVDLGSPTDMVAKAATLAAIFDQGLPPKAAISLVSPTRPAITPRPKAIKKSQQAVEG